MPLDISHALAALAGAAMCFIVVQWQADRKRIKQLETSLAEIGHSKRTWLDQVNLEARTEVLAISQLMKLSTHDSLDALRRLNPQLAEEVIKDVMTR